MLKKIIALVKKNYKIILVVFIVLVVTGILRKTITAITLFIGNLTDKSGLTDKQKIDYDFLAMTIHNDFSWTWFDFDGNGKNSGVMGIINSLPNTAAFLELARRYALKYSDDLRDKLRSKFSDSDYAKLVWK